MQKDDACVTRWRSTALICFSSEDPRISEWQKPQRAIVSQFGEYSSDFLLSIDGGYIKLSEEWLVDSGATQYITYSKEYEEIPEGLVSGRALSGRRRGTRSGKR